jgi:hypothetical protein
MDATAIVKVHTADMNVSSRTSPGYSEGRGVIIGTQLIDVNRGYDPSPY